MLFKNSGFLNCFIQASCVSRLSYSVQKHLSEIISITGKFFHKIRNKCQSELDFSQIDKQDLVKKRYLFYVHLSNRNKIGRAQKDLHKSKTIFTNISSSPVQSIETRINKQKKTLHKSL